jgi:molybdopterin-guanine dinucleotide biosynthesis protein A
VKGSGHLTDDVTAAILVGGRSSRFGQDKVLLSIDGKPLIAHLYDLLKQLVGEILVVGHYRQEFDEMGISVVEDLLPGAGPLGGIYSALISAHTPYVLAVAADMPFLTASIIEKIIEYRRRAEAVIPQGPRGSEPLCAVYSRSCADPIRSSLDSGNHRIITALEGFNILTPEIKIDNEGRDPFFNINYPEDLEKI